jgi:hypothetical protein
MHIKRKLIAGVAAAAALAAIGQTAALAQASILSGTKLVNVSGSVLGTQVNLGLGLPGLCDLGGNLPTEAEQLACALESVPIELHSIYEKPGSAPIERTKLAVVNVPMALDVDADIAPDVIATLQVLSLDHFVLKIDRMLTETSDLPVLIEVLVDDPTKELPRKRLNLGYDARGSKAPQTWSGTIDLLENSDTTTKLGLTFAKTGATPKLAVLGGLFNGTGAAKADKIGGRLTYTPVPASVGATLTLKAPADKKLKFPNNTDIVLTSTAATKLSAVIDDNDGDRISTTTGTIDKLPPVAPTTLNIDKQTEQKGKIFYDAPAKVTAIDVDLLNTLAGDIQDHTVIGLKDVPKKIIVDQQSRTKGTVEAVDAPIGQAAVAMGSQRHPNVPAAAPRPYVRYEAKGSFDVPGATSTALRVDRLSKVTYDLGDAGVEKPPMEVDALFGAGTPLDMDVSAVSSDHAYTAFVDDMPQHIHANVDIGKGHIYYNGFGSSVKQIAVSGVGSPSAPLFKNFDHVDARVDALPPEEVTIDYAPDGWDVDMVASAGVGQLQADVREGADGCLDELGPDESGAMVIVTQEVLECAAGRIDGLKEVHVRDEPFSASFKTEAAQTARVKVIQKSNDQNPTTLEANIDKLPSELSLKRKLGFVSTDSTARTEDIEYRATPDSTPVDHIDVTVRGDNLKGDLLLEHLPTKLDLKIPTQGTVTSFEADTYGEGIGLVAADLRTTGDPHVVPENEDTVRMYAGHSTIRIHDLDTANLLAPFNALPEYDGTFKAGIKHSAPAKPFHLEVDSAATKAKVDVAAPPQDIALTKTGTINPQFYGVTNDTKQTPWHRPDTIQVRASAPTPELQLRLKSEDVAIAGTIQNIPANWDFCMWSGYGALNSGVDDEDDTWCYKPEKTFFETFGGDPYTVYDNIQLSLDDLDGPMTAPLSIPLLRICANPTGVNAEACLAKQELDTVTIDQLTTGEVTLAAGAGVIYPCADAIEDMALLYGTVFDSDECDEHADNEGMHLYLDTDDHGMTFNAIEVDSPDTPGNETEKHYLKVTKPAGALKGDHAVRVLDTNLPPSPDYYRNSLSCPASQPTDFTLQSWVMDTVAPTLMASTLQPLLFCV